MTKLPNPLRVGVWGALSYIVGNAAYRLLMALISLLMGAVVIGMFLLALWIAATNDLL